MKTLDWLPGSADTTGWKARHRRAVRRALQYDTHLGPLYAQHGYVVVRALAAWIEYAEEHERRFGDGIGTDSFLGPVWCQWGMSLRALLNGDMGELDCGTLDAIINDNLTEQGFDEANR